MMSPEKTNVPAFIDPGTQSKQVGLRRRRSDLFIPTELMEMRAGSPGTVYATRFEVSCSAAVTQI